MDEALVERLRFAQQVKDRLDAQAPNNVRGPHCWFCGSGRPWFQCDCKKAKAAQEARDKGRRDDYPCFNVRTNCIENLDEETIRFNEGLGFKRAPSVTPPLPVTPLPPPKRNAVTPKPVHAEPEGVHAASPSVHATPANQPSVNTAGKKAVHVVDAEVARKAYRAEWQRQRRAKQREGA